jgi:hypothetical protein
MRSLSPIWLMALATLMSAATTGAAADRRDFTFAGAEYRGVGGLDAARAFVAGALPPGLPMAEAVRRAREAESACRPQANGDVLCSYYTVARPESGDLGEDYWYLRLTPAADGRLGSASVWRVRVGMSGLWDSTTE